MRRWSIARPVDVWRLNERVLAELNRPHQFRVAVRPSRDFVLKLNRCLDVPLVVADQAQRFHDWRIPLSEWRVGSVNGIGEVFWPATKCPISTFAPLYLARLNAFSQCSGPVFAWP